MDRRSILESIVEDISPDFKNFLEKASFIIRKNPAALVQYSFSREGGSLAFRAHVAPYDVEKIGDVNSNLGSLDTHFLQSTFHDRVTFSLESYEELQKYVTSHLSKRVHSDMEKDAIRNIKRKAILRVQHGYIFQNQLRYKQDDSHFQTSYAVYFSSEFNQFDRSEDFKEMERLVSNLTRDRMMKIRVTLTSFETQDKSYSAYLNYELIRTTKSSDGVKNPALDSVIERIRIPYNADTKKELPTSYLRAQVHNTLDPLCWQYDISKDRILIQF